MLKVFLKIILVLIPILFAIGVIRMMVNDMQPVDGNFVPTWDRLQSWFASFPNFYAKFNAIIEQFGASSNSLCEVSETGNVFENLGYLVCRTWDDGWGNVISAFQLVWQALTVPFEVLGWFFQIFVI